ncbi:MAG: sporulation protein [Chloroflexota bacterium]|nr:sporulation protein [Chloroflexota bacterium]
MKIQETLAQAQEAMTVKRVYGEPFEKDGVTIIPAAAVRGGGGGGGGDGGGVGYGIVARPVGAFIVKGGEVTWKPAVDATRVALRAMLIPIVGLLVFRSVVLAIAKRR